MENDALTDVLTHSILHLPVACIISRASTTEIVAVNDAAVQLFGYDSRADLITRTVADITAQSHRQDLGKNYVVTLDTGLTTVKRYVRRDGTEFSGQLFATPLAGHPDVAIAVVIDLEQADAIRAGDLV